MSVHRIVTDKILSSLDDAGQWRPSWHCAAFQMPKNGVSGHRYRGINILLCLGAQQDKGYGSHRWATYRQWQDVGAQVRRGEKATPVIYYGQAPSRRQQAKEDETYRFAKMSFVFNANQVDGDPEADAPLVLLPESERIAAAEAMYARMLDHATIEHCAGYQPHYSRHEDAVKLPPFSFFKDAHGYYATLFHELAHWTGAEGRLGRTFGKQFGDADYAFEELVAELTAAFVCAAIGIENEPRPDHAAYVAFWHNILKQDERAIMRAASLASRAADYLDGLAYPVEEDLAA